MRRRYLTYLFVLAAFFMTGPAWAEAITMEAVMQPKQQMKLDFKDGSKRFVLMVRREGKASGSGPFDGAAVTEYGMHDITRGVGGNPRGFLEINTPNGDIAYIQWRVRAVFFGGDSGKPKITDDGIWELVGGTGRFKGMRGLGTMEIKAVSKTDRLFKLEGKLGNAP